MLSLLKKLNIDKDSRAREVLNFSFVLSICWHICLFSIVFIRVPNNIEKYSSLNSLNFIGSFLKKYDFEAEKHNFTSVQTNKYLNFAKQNVSALDVRNYAKLDNLPEKPGNSLLATTAAEEYGFRLGERLLMPRLLIKDASSAENDFFDVKNLPNMKIYFQEGLPGPVKFDLYINERGGVSFLKKAITSGSFDADMAVQRALIRTVFDSYHFGVIHRRIIELDLKK